MADIASVKETLRSHQGPEWLSVDAAKLVGDDVAAVGSDGPDDEDVERNEQ